MNTDAFLSRWPGHEEVVASLIEEMIAGEKTLAGANAIAVIGIILCGAAYINTSLLGIHWAVMVAAVTPAIITEYISFYYFNKYGALNPGHLFWDNVEDACVTLCFAVLLIAHGTAASALWFIIGANLAGHAKRPHQPFLPGFQILTFSGLIGYFLWNSQPVDAAVTLLLGSVSLWAIKVTRDTQIGLLNAEVQRVQTRRALHEARIEAERVRLSHAIETGMAREMEQMLRQIESIPDPPANLKAIVEQTSEHFSALYGLVDGLRETEPTGPHEFPGPQDADVHAEMEALVRSQYKERIEQLRTPKHAALFALLGLLMFAVYQYPAVAEALRVPPTVLYSAILVSVFFNTIPVFTVSRLGALSSLQLNLDRLEAAAVFASGLTLIYFSGSATSIFWFVILSQMLNIKQNVLLSRFILSLHAVGYCTLAIAFGFKADSFSDAAMVLTLGGTALWVLHSGVGSKVSQLRLTAESSLMLRALEEAHVGAIRRRVARDLHDGVAADLVSLVMQGRNIQQTPEDLIQRMEIASLIVQAQASLEDLRNVVWGLDHDGSIRWNELVARLQRKALGFTQGMCELRFESESLPELELSLDVALNLIRVLQEGLRNAIRYAEPECIWVRLKLDDEIVLDVWDNGPGFPPDLVPSRGLKNLEERATNLGGKFDFWSQDGAHLRWSIPVDQSQRISGIQETQKP